MCVRARNIAKYYLIQINKLKKKYCFFGTDCAYICVAPILQDPKFARFPAN